MLLSCQSLLGCRSSLLHLQHLRYCRELLLLLLHGLHLHTDYIDTADTVLCMVRSEFHTDGLQVLQSHNCRHT